VDDVPEILANVFAWTKMFRREFLVRTGLTFPEGVRYEDQVPMTRAYVAAEAFDVIPEPVYVWRRRDDGTSITQQKAEASDLHDRLAAKREISKMLVGTASDAVIANWYAKVFRLDLMGYMRAALRADDEYWRVLCDDVAALLERAPADIDDHVEVRFRVAAHLTANHRRDALQRLLDYEDLALSNFPVRTEDGELFADLGFLGPDAGIPRELLRLRGVDRRLTARLDVLDWREPGQLGVRGVAVVRHVAPAEHDIETGLALLATGLPTYKTSARAEPDPVGNVFANRLYEDHTDSTFRAVVDLAELVRRSPADTARTTWDVAVTTTAFAETATRRFEEARSHGSAVIVRSVVVDGALVTSRWVEDQGLKIDVRRRYARLLGVQSVDGGFELDLVTTPASRVDAVLVDEAEVPAEVSPHPEEEGRQTVRVSAADLAKPELPGRLHLDCGWPQPGRLWLVQPLEIAAGDLQQYPTALVPHREGIVRVVPHTPSLFVDDVEFVDGHVRVHGRTHELDTFGLTLAGPRASSPEVQVTAVGGHFEALVRTEVDAWGGGPLPLPSNVYRLTARTAEQEVDARAGKLEDEPSGRGDTPGWSLGVTERGMVTLRRANADRPEEASAFWQQQLRAAVYEPARSAPRAQAVFFECFGGSSCGDSPRAVFEVLRSSRPDLDLVWGVKDRSVPVPEGGRAVLRQTPEWWEMLGTARYLVNNNNFVPRFRKAPNQVYVQTWHGTPLKRIGLDIANQRNFTESYLRLMEREAEAWDYLVSPSPFCSEVFPRAFGYSGEVLEIGYPRNDLLVSGRATELRDAVRRTLGIADGQSVLLYAPTWRENARQASSYAKVLYLDASQVTSSRPDVTVLVRGHANTSGRAAVTGDRVLDVTGYPDIGHLFAASDLLVTDYSSVLFDYALTDRPMHFLVPDLDEYRDRLRGFYLDLEDVAPGPLLRSTAEVLEHLDDDPATYAGRRRAVRERFAPYDDGHAAERLVERVFTGPE
jgi:CDP-glycerol glycerophosphotransferase